MSLSMDDRDGFIWLDGKLVAWRDSRLHVLTHALHYGSAVFEGERIYDGRVFRLAAHSQRLINSARLLDYEIPWTRAEIEEATRAVVKANGLQSGYVRPIAWRGSEVMGVSAIGTTVHLAIAPWAQEGRLSVQARDAGINVTMARYRRPSADFAPGHAKVAGLYLICGIEKDKALKAGFDDALMLDWKGDLAESTGANIFLVIDGTLVTPTPENFLDGITRRAVMGLARKRGWAVEERTVKPQELGLASEVFLCGTAAEIVPVGSLDGHQLSGRPGCPYPDGGFSEAGARARLRGLWRIDASCAAGRPGGLSSCATVSANIREKNVQDQASVRSPSPSVAGACRQARRAAEEPGLRPRVLRPHGDHPLSRVQRLVRRAHRAAGADPDGPGRRCPALRAGNLRRAQGLSHQGRQRDHVPAAGERAPLPAVGRTARHAEPARGVVPRGVRPPGQDRPRMDPRRRRRASTSGPSCSPTRSSSA